MVNKAELFALLRGGATRRLNRSMYVPPGSRLASRGSTRSFIAKRRAAGSRTASKLLRYRKRKQNPMQKKLVRSTSGGMPSFSKFVSAMRPSPRIRAMKKVAAANTYVTNAATQLIVSEGFQAVEDYKFIGTNVLKNMATHVPGQTALYPNVPKQFVLESSTCEYLITNSTLATVYIDIYDVVRRRDADNDVSGTLHPTLAWQQGSSNQAGGNLLAINYINSLPTDSRQFKDYFKVKQRSHIGLAQGATHRHHLALKPNKLIDTALLDSKDADEDLAGLAVYTMIVVYGQPASIKQEGAPAVVTTASAAIDIVKAERHKFTWVSDTTNTWYGDDNLSSLVGETIVSAGAGQFVANQYA